MSWSLDTAREADIEELMTWPPDLKCRSNLMVRRCQKSVST